METKSNGNDIDTFVAQYKARQLVVPACKNLEGLGTVMDDAEKKDKVDHILAAIAGVDKYFGDLSADDPDSTWDELIECANQTQSKSQRAEALRVAAMWEHWRSASFQKAYRDALPIPADACKGLDSFDLKLKDAAPKADAMGSYKFPDNLEQISTPLARCVAESEKLNHGKPVPEFARAYEDLWELSSWAQLSDYNKSVAMRGGLQIQNERPLNPKERQWRDQLADPLAFVTLAPEDQLQSAELSNVAAHNRKLCDQVVTIAGLTPNGLALYIPREGQSFMAKNAKNYPRMCLLQDATSVMPGVPRYLLVWAYSEAAFAGFQPVQQVTTAPVSGTGTLTNAYGERWNFSYTGTMTEIDTVEAPYVLQSRTLYLWAYDEKGNVVSRHSITTSNQAGGDASYAAGYNAGALISLLWNNPSHLIKSVLKDVQKASGH